MSVHHRPGKSVHRRHAGIRLDEAGNVAHFRDRVRARERVGENQFLRHGCSNDTHPKSSDGGVALKAAQAQVTGIFVLSARGRRDGDAEARPRTHDGAADRQGERRFVLGRKARVRGSKTKAMAVRAVARSRACIRDGIVERARCVHSGATAGPRQLTGYLLRCSTESRADSRVALHNSSLAGASVCTEPDVAVKASFG